MHCIFFLCSSVISAVKIWDSRMQFGRVLGTATATVKHPTFQGERLLVVALETADGRSDGEPILVFDRLGARRGDRVIVTNDGAAMQELLGRTTPARWSVLGLPDR
jgi:ethanolamine utilization protein EutN